MEYSKNNTDIIKVSKSKKIVSIFILFSIFISQQSFSYVVTYKEQFYKLYHIHYQQYPDDVIENIYWLEKAAKADFCNPLYAMAKINNEKDWEKYRYLFMMHINLKLLEQHLRLGRIYDKKIAYFYDAPWKEEYLSNLETAEQCYKTALVYWKEALLWSEKASIKEFYFLNLQEIQYWEDENLRISQKSLDYEKTINRELTRINKVKQQYLEMNSNTY